MDNLTHSLIGAALGYAGLKRRSGLAMPALIIGANLPDIDSGCTVFGTVSLAMRRGLTHGPPALVILPLILAAALVLLDRWQHRRGTRPAARAPVRPGWLCALALLACLSHPALDWLNSYGIRLLEPFSSRWFYGDALFIVDGVLWLLLGCAVWLGWRRERDGGDWRRPARLALCAAAAYIPANLGISALAVQRGLGDQPRAQVAVANPVPLAFWRRDLLFGEANRWQRRSWSLVGGAGPPQPVRRRPGCAWPSREELATLDAPARAFLFWSRLPFAEAGPSGALRLRDARFADAFTRDRFAVPTGLPCRTGRTPAVT